MINRKVKQEEIPPHKSIYFSRTCSNFFILFFASTMARHGSNVCLLGSLCITLLQTDISTTNESRHSWSPDDVSGPIWN